MKKVTARRATGKSRKQAAVAIGYMNAPSHGLDSPTTARKPRGGQTVAPAPPSVNLFQQTRTELGLKQKQMEVLVGRSVRKISALETGEHPPTADDIRRYCELKRLGNALAKIVKREAIAGWLETSNPYFDHLSPRQVIERGEIDRVWRLVWRLKDGVPLD